MDVNKTDVVAPIGSGGPKKEENRGNDEEQREKNHDTEAEASGTSPWEGTEAFAVDGLLAGVLTPEIQQAFDSLARQIEPLRAEVERAKGRTKPIKFEVIIESAAGIAHVEEIAAGSPRLEAMSLGAADFAASMGMQTTGIGGTQEDYYMVREGQRYWPDPWHWAQAAIVAACRTHGVLPVDGPFGDFSDDDGFIAQSRRSATLGMVGKWAIHPKQVALSNEVFTPSEKKYCNQYGDSSEHYAVRFAAKEATSKALGVGFGQELDWKDIVISNSKEGKPLIKFRNAVAKKIKNNGYKCHLSMAHCTDYATAVSILELESK